MEYDHWIIYQEYDYFCKKLPTSLPKWLNYVAFPSAMNESSYCSAVSSASSAVSIFNFGHSNKCIVVCHCFSVQSPSSICWTYFQMLSLHLYTFLSEVSVEVFAYFKNQVVFLVLSYKSLTVLFQRCVLFWNSFSQTVACLLILLSKDPFFVCVVFWHLPRFIFPWNSFFSGIPQP